MIKARSLTLLVLLASVAPAFAQSSGPGTADSLVEPARSLSRTPSSVAYTDTTQIAVGAEGVPSDAVYCDSGFGHSHDDLSGPIAEFARIAELKGAAPLRARLIRRTSDESRANIFCAVEGRAYAPGPWEARASSSGGTDPTSRAPWSLTMVAPLWRLSHNSGYPSDRNDGALWAGRGFNAVFSTGLIGHRGPVSARITPKLLFHENRDFETVDNVQPPGYSPYIYPWHPGRIDWPQRPGEQALSSVDPGQSYLRVDTGAVSLGVSTENLWWGPALHNPLLLSNTAPGFPHLFLGSRRPVSTPIGDVEAQVIWGSLRESKHFDGESNNDRRAFGGFIVDVQPRPIPGLFLGMARAHVRGGGSDGLSLGDHATGPFARPASRNEMDGRDPSYRLLSFFARWAVPGAGFEAYAEWASAATWASLSDFLREPERGQSYVIGAQRVRAFGERWLRVYGELSNLTGSTRLPREGGAIAFYTDPLVPQGHTHRGQLLGAFIGPGADAQLFGVDLYDRWGQLGLFAERIRRDDDAFYTIHSPFYAQRGPDVELSAGIRQLLFLSKIDLGWTLGYAHRRNRNFINLDRFRYDFPAESNWRLDVQIHLRTDTGARTTSPPVTATDPDD